jgi:FixJ family two-component response regulator
MRWWLFGLTLACVANVGITVYVIDPDPVEQRRISGVLASDAETVLPFASAETFLESRPLRTPAVLVSALVLPGMGIVDLIAELGRAGIALPVIAIGADVDVSVAVEIMRAGAADFIERPFSARRLKNAVRKLCGRQG